MSAPMAMCAFGLVTCGPGAESQERDTLLPLYLESPMMSFFVLLGGGGLAARRRALWAQQTESHAHKRVYPVSSSQRVKIENGLY